MIDGRDVEIAGGVDEGLSVGVLVGDAVGEGVTVGDADGEGWGVAVAVDEGVGVGMTGEPLGVTLGLGVALGCSDGPLVG